MESRQPNTDSPETQTNGSNQTLQQVEAQAIRRHEQDKQAFDNCMASLRLARDRNDFEQEIRLAQQAHKLETKAYISQWNLDRILESIARIDSMRQAKNTPQQAD